MIRFKMTGLDEMKRKLERLHRRARSLNGPVPFEELFPPEFMRRYTDYKTIDEMIAAVGTPVRSTDDFERIPSDVWESIVRGKTRFNTWDDMQRKAGEEYAARRLDLDDL